MAARTVARAKTWLELGTKFIAMPAGKTFATQATTNGLPALDRLNALATAAIALKLPAIPTGRRGKAEAGIAFIVKEFYSLRTVFSAHEVTGGSKFVPQPRVGRCCENEMFPVTRANAGDLVIKQSKTPCGVCIHAFCEYAKVEQCTIVVQTESATDKTTLVFSKTGHFFKQA